MIMDYIAWIVIVIVCVVFVVVCKDIDKEY